MVFHKDVYPLATNGAEKIDSKSLKHHCGTQDLSLWEVQPKNETAMVSPRPVQPEMPSTQGLGSEGDPRPTRLSLYQGVLAQPDQ